MIYPDFDVLTNLHFDQMDDEIGWISVQTCTEANSGSTFTYPRGETEMAALEPYAISIKYVPTDTPNALIGTDLYAFQAVTCSNPIMSVNNGNEPSFTIDYDGNEEKSYADMDNWLGSSTAKSRIENWCLRDDLRSMSDVQYHACGNTAGVHINSGSEYPGRCVWDFANPRDGYSISIYYGFDVNKQKVCDETNGDGSFYNLDPCANVNCSDTNNICTENVCVDGQCIVENKSIGESCADDDKCNGDEACDGNGQCQSGIAISCDDGNQCTDDTCDSSTGLCSYVNSAFETLCDDGNLCTVGDYCEDGECKSNERECKFGEECNSENGECEAVCDVFDIDKYSESCSNDTSSMRDDIDANTANIEALGDRIDNLKVSATISDGSAGSVSPVIDTFGNYNYKDFMVIISFVMNVMLFCFICYGPGRQKQDGHNANYKSVKVYATDDLTEEDDKTPIIA